MIAGTLGSAGGKSAGSATSQDADSGLLIAESLRSHPRPGSNSLGAIAFGGNNTAGAIDISTALNSHGGPHGRLDFESETFIATALRARDGAKGVDSVATDTLIPVAFALRGREGGVNPEIRGDATSALRAASGGSSRDYIAFDTTQLTNPNNRSNPKPGDPSHGLSANQHPPALIDITPEVADPISASEADTYSHAGNNPRLHNVVAAVRRLTPRECERLMGFPDDFTLVPYRGKPAADGNRYKGLGNSMAVDVVAWLGERIDAVEDILAAAGRLD